MELGGANFHSDCLGNGLLVVVAKALFSCSCCSCHAGIAYLMGMGIRSISVSCPTALDDTK